MTALIQRDSSQQLVVEEADFRKETIYFIVVDRFFSGSVDNDEVGRAGLFDPSQKIGFTEKDTDFGETLQGWGVAEGAYLELPVFGPSNLRDGFARFVDMLLLDPAGQILKPPVSEYRTASNMGAILQKRQIYGAQIDEVLYGSADSYAQARLVYLQSRRFELKDIANDAYIDPYAEFE